MLLYNSLTKRKEEFIPLQKGKVTMYNCGPTVYGQPSIGNYRSFLVADLLKRYLQYQGYQVNQVMNITDVGHLENDSDTGEDKLEKKARQEKKEPLEIARLYEESFHRDIKKLNIIPAEVYPRATEHIQDMIDLVQLLLDKGIAYEAGGSIYFDLTRFPEYGKLSGNTLEDLIAGKRVEIKKEKRNPFDFALWIHNPDHLMQWEAPWGKGYPGWHLECSVMSIKYLGETIDIHTGGEDNKFPHHECEIAQSEAATGKQFVRFWLHIKHLLVNGGKMSKSLGNTYTIADIEAKGFSLRALRYFLISGHYRQNLNFTFDALEAAEKALAKIQNFLELIRKSDNQHADLNELIEQAKEKFRDSLGDDLNISGALAAVFDFMRKINTLISDGKISRKNSEEIITLMRKFDSILAVMDFTEERETKGVETELIQLLLSYRSEFKASKNWQMADRIRDDLKKMGIHLKDTPDGTIWSIE
ncbi:MAG: cysteine--tRNA ligase [Candidatus Cloacimonetes bacterium]|nr:cysteine--tRNA ligase [Candidatus Cloacimonadota bacterium]